MKNQIKKEAKELLHTLEGLLDKGHKDNSAETRAEAKATIDELELKLEAIKPDITEWSYGMCADMIKRAKAEVDHELTDVKYAAYKAAHKFVHVIIDAI